MADEKLDLLEFFPMGKNRHGFPGAFRIQDDRTLRAWALGVGVDATGAEQPALAEAGRQGATVLWGEGPADLRRLALQDVGGGAGDPLPLLNVPLGWDGATYPNFALENVASGEVGAQKISLYGTDDGGDVVANLADSNQIPWTHSYEEWVDLQPVEIPAAEGDLWNPGRADTVRYMVEFNVVNNVAGGTPAEDIFVGREINSAGGLTRPYYWMFDWTVPYPGDTGWWGPYFIHGDDAIRGVAGGANEASIHFRVKRVDVGA